VTYLNWTVPLAKGTRFILVAGIGSDQQWASGGSSSLLTVGQGSTGCGWNTGDDTAPSVTATTGTYTGDTETSTAGPGAVSSGGGSGGGGSGGGGSTLVRTILACVLSVLGTLLVVGIFLFCRRTRRRRRETVPITKYPLGDGSAGKLTRASADQYGVEPHAQDMPLDLIASRDGARSVAPILTNTAGHVDSPIELSPVDTVDSRRRMMEGMGPSHTADPRSGTLTSYNDSITSPTRTLPPFAEELRRQSSLDPLISRSGTMSPLYSPAGGETYNSGTTALSASRPLMLHDRTDGLPYERADRGLDQDDEEEDLPELKRETLAMGEGSAGPGPAGRRPAGPGQVRRRRRDEELEYVVHRDAGRVRPPQRDEGRRVLELPPRYEELDWEGEERGAQGQERAQEGGPGASARI
jgi:hypothetical protein